MSGKDPSRLEPLETVLRLFEALDDAGIHHCHWKSSAGIPEALAGRSDLDLLVDRGQSARFAACVGSLGFKRFISHSSRQLPGVEDWLGLDLPTRRLIHLHVYYELVLGEELVKNHRLPVEEVLLSNTVVQHGIRVPRPELELAILAVRALLKYREDAFVRDALPFGHRGGLPKAIVDEVHELLGRTTAAAVSDVVDRHLPMLPTPVITGFLEVAASGRRDPRRLRRLRRQLERALLPYRRRGELALLPVRAGAAVSRSRFARSARHLDERVRHRPSGRRKRPAAGGRAIAVIGIDGAGKSTVIDQLVETFGWRINVTTLYLGSARPGLLTAASQATARGTRRLGGWLERRLGTRSPVVALAGRVAEVSTGVRAVAEARDRARRVTHGRRLAAAGWLVFFDRYPMPALRVGERSMDASRLPGGAAAGWLARRLAQRERAIYRAIPVPETLVVLRLDALTARSRKPAAPQALDAKAQALEALGDGDATMVVIDAAAPLENVLRQVTRVVWDRL